MRLKVGFVMCVMLAVLAGCSDGNPMMPEVESPATDEGSLESFYMAVAEADTTVTPVTPTKPDPEPVTLEYVKSLYR